MPDKTVVIKTLESIDNSEIIYPRTSIHALYDENGDPVDVAVLGDDGKIPASQSQVQSVNGQTGEVNLTADDIGAVSTEVVGAANGVASLDESGKVPASQSRIQSVNGQTGEVSLTAVDVGAQATLSGTAGQFVGFNASGAAEPQILPTEIAYVYYGQTGWNELNNHISNNKLVILRVNNTTTNRLDAELKQKTDVKAVFEGKMVDGKVKRYILTSAGAWSNEDVEGIVATDESATSYEPPFDFNFGAGEGEAADAQWLLDLQKYLRSGGSASLGDIVGKTKTITLTSPVLGTTSHLIRVIGVDQDAPNTVTFQTANCLNNTTVFGSNSAVWIGSTARAECQNYYNAFPAKSAIMTVSKGTCADANDLRNGTATYNNETVWLPSEREMGLDRYAPISVANSTTSNAECTQGRNFSYSYYTSNNNRIKKQGDSGSAKWYWERSRHYNSGSSSRVCSVNAIGSASDYTYYYGDGLAPAFVIG